MLPIEPWLNAMNLESGLAPRPRPVNHSPSVARSVRRVVGRGLIAVGQALAGQEAMSGRQISVGR